MMLRGDMDFNRLGLLDWLFNGCFFRHYGFFSYRSNNLFWSDNLYFLWLLLFAELQSEKAERPMLVTLLGITTEVNAEHPLKV